MRYTILALAVALAAGTTQARADMVSYTMTGTITDAWNAPNSSFAEGDHISWTLQYDRSTPLSSADSGTAPAGSWAGYQMPRTYVITNIVDQTTGYHFPIVPPSGPYSGSGMRLSNNNAGYRNISSGEIFVHQGSQFVPGQNIYYAADLTLLTASSLPTLNLANFSFNNLPIERSPNPPGDNPQGYTNFQYTYQNGNDKPQLGLIASVDSVPGAHMVPEPGSLTLFLLGAAGLAARGMRHRLGGVG